MKKFLQLLPMATIVLVIFALISFVWGSDQKRMATVDENFEIIEINEESNLSENEGKYVVVTGTPKVTETPSDTLFGVKSDGYVLVRTVEMYQYTIIDDAVYKHFSSIQNEDIKGKHGESYVNPDFPSDLKNAVFFGKMAVGQNEIPVSEDFIETIRTKQSCVSDKIELKDIENLEIKGYKSCGDGYYTKADPDNWKIGDIRIKFSYLPSDALDKVTVGGLLKNGVVTYEEQHFGYASDSEKSIPEIITETRGEHGNNANGLYTIGIIEIIIAVIVFFIKKLRSKKV
ncbi:MAG: TMEM43 family protein [Clostridia bacterium]|nr:TMEM43 family protein [Clostridia bacterium]